MGFHYLCSNLFNAQFLKKCIYLFGTQIGDAQQIVQSRRQLFFQLIQLGEFAGLHNFSDLARQIFADAGKIRSSPDCIYSN